MTSNLARLASERVICSRQTGIIGRTVHLAVFGYAKYTVKLIRPGGVGGAAAARVLEGQNPAVKDGNVTLNACCGLGSLSADRLKS